MPLAVLVGIGVAGIVTSAVGQVKAGNAGKRAGEFNAQGLEAQSDDALARGQDESSRLRSQVRGLIGTQRAAYAGQNVRVNSGSALDVQADTAGLGEMDAQQITQNAKREAWGYRQDAQSSRMGGQAAQSAGRWGAASSTLGGTTSLLTTVYGWNRSSAGRRR